jgi:hypothetical protein
MSATSTKIFVSNALWELAKAQVSNSPTSAIVTTPNHERRTLTPTTVTDGTIDNAKNISLPCVEREFANGDRAPKRVSDKLTPLTTNGESDGEDNDTSNGHQQDSVRALKRKRESSESVDDGELPKRRTRTRLNTEQFTTLETLFKSNPWPTRRLRKELADSLNLTTRKIQVW